MLPHGLVVWSQICQQLVQHILGCCLACAVRARPESHDICGVLADMRLHLLFLQADAHGQLPPNS